MSDGCSVLSKSLGKRLNGVTTYDVGDYFAWTDNNSGDGAPSCVLTGAHPPAAAPSGSGKIVVLCYPSAQRLTGTFTPQP